MAVKSHSTSSTVSTPGVPKLHVEGQPIHDDAEEHRNTSNTNQVQQRQPFVDEAGCSVGDDRPPSPQGARRDLSCENGSLDDILRAHSVEHRRSNAHAHRFLGYKRLQRIMTRPRIRNALLKECNPHFECTEAERYCDLILPQQQSPCPPYLRIFAILILADKGHDIEKFLQPVFSDDQFSLDTNVGGLLDEKNLGWRRRDWDIFETYQRKVLVPYFQMSSEVNKSVQNYELHPDTLLPWLAHQSGEGGKDWVKRGGYATVETVKIDADSHDFKSLLDRLELYSDLVAVKSLDPKDSPDREAFERERTMLERYGAQAQKENSSAHKHMITLLASYTLGDKSHFIFPAAKCNLDEYFGERDGPLAPLYRPINQGTREWLVWISEQTQGLVGAVDYMHSAKRVYLDPKDKYARHGDLKLENILWFLSPFNKRGRLVIGDLGIADIHGEHSRSQVPNENLPTTATYRAPECDILDAKISRAYDIWTLGCVFLEMICWMLGGDALRQEFSNERLSKAHSDVQTFNYFDVRNVSGDLYRFKVKHAVIKFIEKLHRDEGCTPYVHELLDVISDGMLRVLPQDRYSSKELLNKLKNMHKKCNSEDYVARPSSRPWNGYRDHKENEALEGELNSQITRAKNNPHVAALSPWSGRSATQGPPAAGRKM